MNQIFQAHKIIELPSTDSTNNYAANLLKHDQVSEGTVILSYYQTNGRGQRGASWESVKGLNLTFSIVLYPKFINAQNQFVLNKVVSLALYEFLQERTSSTVRIKWPNDILVDRQKIAGVLIENTLSQSNLEHSIIGVGLNLNQREFSTPRATSLTAITGKSFDILEACKEISSRILRNYHLLRQKGADTISDLYRQRLLGLNEERFFQHNGQQIIATIQGIDGLGKLLLVTEAGEKITCDLREIEFIY